MNKLNYENHIKDKLLFLKHDLLDIKNEDFSEMERALASKHARKLIAHLAGFVFDGKDALKISKMIIGEK